MREIEIITVLKDGFLLRAQGLKNEPTLKSYPYLLVFNLIENHNFVSHIAEYTKGKSKGESSKCPGEHLLKIYKNDVSAYKIALRKCIEESSRDDRNRPFGEKTLFTIYEDIEDDGRPPRIKGPEIRKTFFFESFIHKEKHGREDLRENLRFWLGDCNTTDIKFKTEKTVSDYGATPPKDEKSKELGSEDKLEAPPQPIHPDTDNNTFRFITKTEDLDYALLKSPKGFNIREAQEDMFRVERKENDELASHIKEGCSVLVKGPMKIGKTRLVFEELRKLKGYYVFSLYQSALQQADKLSFPPNFNQENKKIIWFIDDIDYFSSVDDKLWSIYEKLVPIFEDIIVIATLRATEDIKSQLIKYMEPLNVSIWDDDEADELTEHYPQYQRANFAGTPFSLIKDIKQMKELYNSKQISLDCRYVFRYLKLLYLFLQFIERDLLKEVYEFLREKSKGTDDFEESLSALESVGFIDRKDGLVLSWEPYLENIVINEDYDFDQIVCDIVSLTLLFSELREVQLLVKLGNYFSRSKYFKYAILCYRLVIKIVENEKNIRFLGYLYNNLGLSFNGLAKLDGDSEKFEKAIEMYEKAVEIYPNYATAHLNCATAWFHLEELDGDSEKYGKAMEKCEEAVASDPNNKEIHFDLISIFEKFVVERNSKEKKLRFSTKEFLLFILRKEWKAANEIAVSKIFNKFKRTGVNPLYDIVCIFNAGLTLIMNPEKELSDEIKILQYMEIYIEEDEKKYFKPHFIILNAIFENKKPDIEVDSKSNKLPLNAAIVLANEIVARSSSS